MPKFLKDEEVDCTYEFILFSPIYPLTDFSSPLSGQLSLS